MTTSSDELVGKLSAMVIVGDEDQGLVDDSVTLADNYIDLPEEDPQSSVQYDNVVGFRDRTTEGVYEFIKNTIVGHSKTIKSPDEQSLIQNFLRFFDEEIQKIVQQNVHDAGDNTLSWKVAEECYKEAISLSGVLNADRYLEDFKNSQPRRRVDSVSGNQYHIIEKKRKRQWIEFWVTVLDLSPGGPTLFYPLNSSDTNLGSSTDIPRYLFRVFDEKSSGINNEEIIASSGRNSYINKKGRDIDLMSMPPSEEATDLIFYHLRYKDGKQDTEDNLVSWTSSLLYAIQYAVYIRDHPRRGTDIKICMVDTHKFPQGQFVRDIQLIETYLPTVENLHDDTKRDKIESFFQFRLGDIRYYNGEYLSQGVLNHAGRSCVVDFTQLESAGLYQLYPQFKDVGGRYQWANRVRDLRQEWSDEHTTTDNDVPCALKIARKCFPDFDEYDVACILLALKNRKLSDGLELTTNQAPSWADKPVEVNRYWQILETRKHLREDLGRETNLQDDIYKIMRRSIRIVS